MLIKTPKFKALDIMEKLKARTHDELDKAIQKQNTSTEVTPLPPPPNWEQNESVMLKTRGYWEIFSFVDDRWRAKGISEVGGKSMPPEAQAKFEEFKKQYKHVPYDLRFYFEPVDLKNFKISDDFKIEQAQKYINQLEKKI